MKIYTQAQVDELLIAFGSHLILEYSERLRGDAPDKERRAKMCATDELVYYKDANIPAEIDTTPFSLAGDIIKAAKTTIDGTFGEREKERREQAWEQLDAYVSRKVHSTK
jgi:hypothetical protein